MEQMLELYQELGISPAVYAYGEQVLEKLKDRFAVIDQVAEYNQAKVIRAMQKNRVSAACFTASNGSLGRQLSVLYLSFQRYSTIIFFCCHIFPHGDVIGNFLSCFCHGFLSFFPVSFYRRKG